MLNLDITKLTWPSIQETLPLLDALLIPLGSTEQHGPHLPVNNDTFIARSLARLIVNEAEKRGRRLAVGITVPFGCSDHHIAFPGTVSVSGATYKSLIKEVALCYRRHGVRGLVFINGHGGNSSTAKAAIEELKAEADWKLLSLFNYWEYLYDVAVDVLDSRFFCHACEGETSLAKALGQQVWEAQVYDALKDNPYLAQYNLLNGEAFTLPRVDQISETGVIGDPSRATQEKGHILIRAITDAAIGLFTG